MVNLWNDTNTYTIPCPIGIGYSVVYKDLMTAAGLYTPYTEDTFRFLTDAQKEMNEIIDKKTSFDATVYYQKWTKGVIEDIDKTNYDRTTVDGFKISSAKLVNGTPLRDGKATYLSDLKSYNVYGATAINVYMGASTYTDNERSGQEAAEQQAKEDEYDPKDYEFPKEKLGDEVSIYFMVMDPFGELRPTCIKFIRTANEEEEKEEEKDDSSNSDELINVPIFAEPIDDEDSSYGIDITVSDSRAVSYLEINYIPFDELANNGTFILTNTKKEASAAVDDDYSPCSAKDKVIAEAAPLITNNISLSPSDSLAYVHDTGRGVTISNDEKYNGGHNTTTGNGNEADTWSTSFVSPTNLLLPRMDPLCPIPYSFSLRITNLKTDRSTTATYNYTPASTNISGIGYKRCIKMNAPDVSYALLRTNPKLTGNIKVVVDSSTNIYLDTFKISDVMSKKRYRHIKTGADTYYGRGIMSQFKDIPTTELYKVADSCRTMFTPTQTYKGQLYDMYQYGAKTNDDEMYSENFSILAPLCIKRIVPDFFLVFKVNKGHTGYNETYLTDQEKIKYFLSYGKLVKSYDMRNGSELGNYVRKVYEMAKDYPGDVYESYDVNNENRFIGISMDRGVVTAMHESVYPQEKINNQVALNNYITNGFERNHIVSKDIVNFEFLFNDDEDPMFSINTYYGLYVKVNTQDNDFSCIGFKGEDGNRDYIYDTEVNSFQKGIVLSQSNKLATLIYGVTTPTEFKRLDVGLPYSDVNEEFLIKPYKNILTSVVKKIPADTCRSFLTVTVNKPFDVGDHIRIASPGTKTIYEVVMSDLDLLDDFEGDYLDEHNLTEVTTNYYNEYGAGLTIKRISMHIHSRAKVAEDAALFTSPYGEDRMYPEGAYTEDEIINEEAKSLFYAFKKFDKDVVVSWKLSGNTITFVGGVEDLVFERICSPSGFLESQYQYIRETSDEDDALRFFGENQARKFILNIDNKSWKASPYLYLYPLHFELVGSRMAYSFFFVNTVNLGDEKYLYSIKLSDKKAFDTKSIVYYTGNESENTTANFDKIYLRSNRSNVNDVIYTSCKPVSFIQSFEDPDQVFINLSDPKIKNSSISLYSAYPINSGVCSIFQMKDFNFNVIDSDSTVVMSEMAAPISTTKGEYASKNVFTMTSEPDQRPAEITLPTDPMPWFGKDASTFIEDVTLLTEDAWDCSAYDEPLNQVPDFNGNPVTFEELMSRSYAICPVFPDSSVLIRGHADMGLVAHYILNDASAAEETGDASGFWEIDGSLDSSIITDNTESVNIFDTGFSTSPVRNDDEEDFRDYIDVNFSTDASISPWISPEMSQDFLREHYINSHKSFDISLVSPHCCKWTSIGTDARGENMRIMHEFDKLVDASTYYTVGCGDFDSYIGYLYIPDKVSSSFGNVQKYVSKSLYDSYIIERGGDEYTGNIYAKDYILEHLGTIDDLLYNELDNNNKFTTAYISGENTLEFISAGTKIRIHSNNDNALDLNKYNGYSAVFVSLPSSNKSYGTSTELIIDEQRHELLFVWYQAVDTLKIGMKMKEVRDDSSKTGFIVRLPFSNTFGTIKPAFQDGTEGTYKAFTFIDEWGLGHQEIKYPYKIDPNDTEGEGAKYMGQRLCKNRGYIFIGTHRVGTNGYTKPSAMALIGNIYNQKPITESINETFPYYENEGLITGLNPSLWKPSSITELSNAALSEGMDSLGENIDAYIITDSIDWMNSAVGTYDGLKTAVKSCSVFVKTDEGKKDFTKLKGLIDISVVEPIAYYKYQNTNSHIDGVSNSRILGYVHPTYATPLMKDMLVFNYFSSRASAFGEESGDSDSVNNIEEIFHMSFDGANVSIKDVNTLDQVWYTKYTEEPNYCLRDIDSSEGSYRLSVDLKHNVGIMEDSWAFNTYSKYYSKNDTIEETREDVKGYTTGYEVKRYFNSRGIVFHGSDGDKIEIVSWKDSEVNTAEGYIKLNITDSLIYNILFRSSFGEAWNYLSLKGNDAKINYIKNTILDFININNKTKFVLRRSNSPTTFTSFFTDFNDDDTKSVEVINYKNSLKYENGKYYMYVYPEDKYMYYAKMIIQL